MSHERWSVANMAKNDKSFYMYTMEYVHMKLTNLF